MQYWKISGYISKILSYLICTLIRFKLCGGEDIQRLHEDVGILKRWPLTPGYILRPDGIPLCEAATEQVYEIFNGIASEAEYLAKNHDPKQVNLMQFLNIK